MKTTSFKELPVLTLPRLSAKLESVADNLVRYSVEFGLDADDTLAPLVAAIAFVNGVTLGLEDTAAAEELEQLLVADSVPPDGELAGLTTEMGAALADVAVWTGGVAAALTWRWMLSGDCVPEVSSQIALRMRVLHGLRSGLVISRTSPEVAERTLKLAQGLRPEPRFLASCVVTWGRIDWKATGEAFADFVASSYPLGTIERLVMRGTVEVVVPVAKKLNDPWRFSVWAEIGWNTGRGFARNHPEEARALLEDTSPKRLQELRERFTRCVLGTARGDGEVQIEQAALRYIGEHPVHDLARAYCTGLEPRWLARAGYDFGFWAGVFAVYQLPTAP